MPHELRTSVLIVGGGTGGVAAALALGAAGIDCIITEPYRWIGGQLTSQAVPPDENQWVETFGATRRYQRLRSLVREWYRKNRPLNARANEDSQLNPGGGWVSRLCAEPAVFHHVLEAMVAEHNKIKVILGVHPTHAQTQGDCVTSVTFSRCAEFASYDSVTISANVVLDATELGDLYELAGIEHAIGAEHRDVYGELHGRQDKTHQLDQQAFSWCFAIEHKPGENHTITKPVSYGFWNSYVPDMTPKWCGPLLSWKVPSHNVEGERVFPFIPWPDRCPEGMWDMWRYRRIRNAEIYSDGSGYSDICLVNWVQMDYWLKPLLGKGKQTADDALKQSRELSACLLYWMQTAAPRLDGGVGFPGLKLRGEELGTNDGFAMAPYIREPRRLLAKTIVTEQHIGTDQRKLMGVDRPLDDSPYGGAECFPDSVGIGHYTLDLHPSVTGRNSVYVPAAPFRIPMGSLIPQRVTNVLAAGKGIGVSHITNGCYRMHHTEWNIGESAGVFAAYCIENKLTTHAVHASPEHIEEVQRRLAVDGVRIAWPWES